MALVVVMTEPESVGGESWVTVGADGLLSITPKDEFSDFFITPLTILAVS
jgi:hypothetical protein